MGNRIKHRREGGFVIFTFLFLSLAAGRPLCSCTFVSMAKPGIAFAGCNEDYINLPTRIWLFPATAKAYGRMLWGYDRDFAPYQGGMNDQGLFMDINALAFTGWKDDSRRPSIEDEGIDPIEYVLTHFSTVDDVINFFREDDINLGYASYVFADARGKSVVFEWAEGKMQILRKEYGYQLAFNTLQSVVDIPREYPEDRYRIADQILRGKETPNIGLLRRVLSAVCQEFYFNQTLYSTICDLANKKVLLYHFHDFEEPLEFDLAQELKKGEASYSLPDLFPVRPYSENVHRNIGSLIPYQEWQKIIDEKGIEEGIQAFSQMKNVTRTYHRFVFEEWVIKNVGMHYLAGGKLAEAIAVFKLNTEENPNSGDAYADLAAAWLKKGDVQLAVENYEKALAKNPGNKRIEAAVKELRKEAKGQ
jgi:tetratricopeptide (TPR) repeat protein